MARSFDEQLKVLLALPDMERGTGTRAAREEILLERPAALFDALGNPQRRYPSVLIAGTKGKGSTAAMLASILRASGLRTGLYTSPHLHTYRERIRVNGEMIAEDTFARGVGELELLLHELIATHPEFESVTTFEAMTALALWYFAQAGVDIAILEVGVGGRLDATNVVDAELSLITPISFDHTAILGNSLPKIAFEKAGIIKPGKVVLTAQQPPEALAVIEQVAQERNAVLGVGERDWLWLGGHKDFMVAGSPVPGLWNDYWHYRDLVLPLLGAHQFVNAGLAVAAARIIDTWGLIVKETSGAHSQSHARNSVSINQDTIRAGLARAEWAGRLEVLQERDASSPFIVADGAHNGDSAEKLYHALRFHFEFERLYLIFGVLGDKETDAILKPFVGNVTYAWTVMTRHPRSANAQQVAADLQAAGIPCMPAQGPGDALMRARERAKPNDLILFTGSLSLVAEAEELFGKA